ncbi:MAG: CDP-alcohol phosphatidyltransferase family protein [Bacteroidales bacterium]|nr:CDP-alcohol phosphatidyltransferase family protein [Bacteroidales bacterium]
MKNNIPNIITLLNLLSGCVATFIAITNADYLIYAAVFIIAAAVFDFFDGFAARLLKANSELGKQLDSLADLISFGMAPAAILSMFIRQQLHLEQTIVFSDLSEKEIVLILFPFIITAFSALRLAKFNIDTRQTSSFIGMPTPANALFIISLVFIKTFDGDSNLSNLLTDTYTIIGVTLVNSYLLISPLPMFSLKFKTVAFKDNFVRYLLIFLAIVSITLISTYSLLIIMLLYIIISIINTLVAKKEVYNKI